MKMKNVTEFIISEAWRCRTQASNSYKEENIWSKSWENRLENSLNGDIIFYNSHSYCFYSNCVYSLL